APLSVDGGSSGFVDRRRVSVQWFAGTIMTALCGAALMGGAVFTSLDGETNFAALPERVEVALRGALGGSEKSAHKSDRLPTAEEPTFARQVIRVSTINRVGNHEVVRVRPFVRIAGNLSLSVSDVSANIPPFNPQRGHPPPWGCYTAPRQARGAGWIAGWLRMDGNKRGANCRGGARYGG